MSPEAQVLETWLGSWSMLDTEGQSLGRVRFEKASDCGVLETWESDGVSGTVLFSFDSAGERWLQQRVDSRGTVARLEAPAHAGALSFVGEGRRVNGESFLLRLRLEPAVDDSRLQRIEESTDRGETWQGPWAVTFVAAEVEDAAPAPGQRQVQRPGLRPGDAEPEPLPSGSIRSISRQASREQLAMEDRRQIPMASPMVLEVESGAIHQFPEGAAWRTNATAEFVSNRVTVLDLELSKTERRGKIEFSIGVRAHTSRRSMRIKVRVEVLSQGEVLLDSGFEDFKIGLSVPAYDPDDGLVKSFDFELEAGVFAGLFVEDRRPTVRVTVDSPAL